MHARTPHSTSCNASMVLAATDVWIKAWLEGGEGRVSVRVKKNAESRCYVGWKKGGGGGRERKTRGWQLGSEHVAVSQVK